MEKWTGYHNPTIDVGEEAELYFKIILWLLDLFPAKKMSFPTKFIKWLSQLEAICELQIPLRNITPCVSYKQ